ncbi:MAG: transglutaminase domain-containing protein [Candidatus Thorarchaeota archaeon]
MSAEGTTRKRMGITAIISSIFIVASIVWGLYGFALIQFGVVRPYEPHYEYDQIDYWPYTHNFTGSNGNWFDGINYTDLPIDQQLPNDTLDNLDQPVFYVIPADPGQLWRIESYDQYDGSSWTKTIDNTYPLDSTQLIPFSAAPNQPYVILFNASAGAEVGAISLPSIFPALRVIEDSFVTYSIVDDTFVPDNPTRLLHYDLETDDYGTLIFSPLIEGTTGEDVMVSFMVSYIRQDTLAVETDALPGAFAPPYTDMYRDLSLVSPLSQRVIDNYTQFSGAGTNAYETAMAVKVYFQSTFELNLTQEALYDRPQGQEVTDWFLERGNGLPIDFATSYAVFMRGLGIPARMVSGYVVGEHHPTEDMRTLMVRHMSFWVEVFVPMSGHIDGGEWIQVIPVPLTGDMGGDEDPENTPIPDIELLVVPTSGQSWAEIGTPFGLSATISVDGVYIETPDTITFYDGTDAVAIGSAYIGENAPPPIANLTYTFPVDATVDYHTISATWQNSYFLVSNTTQIYAVGTPVPLADESPSVEPTDFVLAQTYDVDINQDIDTYAAYWEDYLHVYGIMTVGGNPVNSSKYGNRYIQIMWDDTSLGDAFIDEYGYYELDVYLDPLNLTLMTVGPHDVWSSYEGDWTGEFYRLLPANSTYTSTVTLWGRVGFDLYVTPWSLFAGGTLSYSGNVYFLNGTSLPAGQTVTTFFATQANNSCILNSTGGFDWTYIIPGAQGDGTYETRANFTSPWQYIAGNWSISVYIDVGAGGSQLTINVLPNPVFIGNTVTIWGYLQHVSNNSGIGSQWVDVYWSAGSITYIGSSFTAADGYYEVSYVIPSGYEGAVTYWANFTSLLPQLTDCESGHPNTFAKRYDVDITIADSPDPIHLLQTVTIQGIVTLPENGSSPVANVLLEIYWANSTYPAGVLIGTTWTNDTGGYAFYHQIPLSHGIEMVDYLVSFTSPFTNIDNGISLPGTLDIIATGTLLTVFSDSTSYYLNQTVLISGNLQFSNGTPFANQLISIQWINASGTWPFEKHTDINGDYFFQYNLSASMDTGLVDVHVDYTATSGLYDDAADDLAPSIQLNKYDLVLVLTVPTEIYVDEDLVVQGILTTSGGSPMVGAGVYIAYDNGTAWIAIRYEFTNSTGGFISTPAINFSGYAEGTYTFAVIYYSPDPVVNDLGRIFYVDRVKYAINLEITVLPNPVMQNETVTVFVYLYFAHNSTPIINAQVSIWWNNGSLFWLGNITTDGAGLGNLPYTGMDNDTFRVNIEVYGYYAGTILRADNESIHRFLTLEQWESDLVGLGTPVGSYNLLDTVLVTGTLMYVLPSIPYGGAYVELLVLGVPVDNTTTAIDGTFTLLWTIPSDTLVGDYDLEVRYLAPYPWIQGVQEFVPTITITAPGYDFPSFVVIPEAPTTVIILDYLTIAGIVNYDNGTPFAFSIVYIYWNPTGTDEVMKPVMTDGAGTFVTNFQVPAGTPLGFTQVWLYIPPAAPYTFGMSTPRTIDVDIHSLVITASVDVTTAHLGETITISGTAHFLNNTPLTGHAIEIWWDSTLISTEPVDLVGNFSYSHFILYTDPVGVNAGYVFFGAPTAAFPNVTENFADVEVREYVDISMNTLPGAIRVSRGDTISILGTVDNNGGVGAVDVEIRVLINNIPTATTGFTDALGLFLIDWDIPDFQAAGQFNITIVCIDPYRDVLSSTGVWFVDVVLASTLDVQVSSGAFMPGETVTLTLSLHDVDGTPIDGTTIELILDATVIGTVTLSDGSGSAISVTIPSSWATDGYYAFTAVFAGDTYLYEDSGISIDSIHVFTDVVITDRWPDSVATGRSFTIEALITDPSENPIIDRTVTIDVDGITSIDLTTDSEGIISLDLTGQNEGTVEFTITLTSDDVDDVVSGTYEIMIQTQGGIILQGTDLIIAGVLLVGAVIAVLAYLYIVKGMFRSVVISRGIDIPTKLRNIKKLADAGKYGASITLAYRTFEQMCGTKMGSERTHSETAREYLDRVMKSIPLDGSTVEQFVQTYEEARFSHHEMTRERYEAALRVFTDLYPRIDTSAPLE